MVKLNSFLILSIFQNFFNKKNQLSFSTQLILIFLFIVVKLSSPYFTNFAFGIILRLKPNAKLIITGTKINVSMVAKLNP
jgi:hypothetical protein